MYNNLIETLRFCAKDGNCRNCPYEKPCDGTMGDGLYCEAADAIEELSKTRWIPVTKQYPFAEYGEEKSVLTVDSMGEQHVLYFDGGNWCWPSGEVYETARAFPITHWMPLPEPPKEVPGHE